MRHLSSHSADYLECDFPLHVQILGCEDGSDQESELPSEAGGLSCSARYQLVMAARTVGEIVKRLRAHQIGCSVCSSLGTADPEAGLEVSCGGSFTAAGGTARVGQEVCDASL